MNIGIIGTGSVGGALTRACRAAGHEVKIASTNPEEVDALARETGAVAAADNARAVEGTDIVILAVPYSELLSVAAELHDELVARIVVDVTNPVAPDLDHRLTATSAAEELAATLDGESVVKAFNTVLASRQDRPLLDGERIEGFFATDDDRARIRITELLDSLGYEPIDCGPLTMARALEDMALVNIRLNAIGGWSWQTVWRLVGPRG
ncbi:MAG: NADPH-dependent F420 reductase [Coriobacteriia bacterium]